MKPLISTLEACDVAATLLKRAGFELRNPSRTTEACYYALPGRDKLLRVAAHSTRRSPAGFANRVVARLTFAGTHVAPGDFMRLHPDKLEQMVEAAIGRYMLRSNDT